MGNLVITYCGCVQYLQSILVVKDSNLLPATDIYIGWLSFDGMQYPIDQVFADQEALLEYLNTTFVNLYSKDGMFQYASGNMEYSNPEDYQNSEIMIQYGQKPLIFKIGNDAPPINREQGYDGTFPNGSTFSHPELYDMAEISVRVGNVESEPIADGHQYISEDPDNPGMGKITFPYILQDINLYIFLSQKPA